MSFSTQLWELVRAGFPAIWIQTHEVDEAIAETAKISRANGINLLRWNISSGLQLLHGSVDDVPSVNDPLNAVRFLRQTKTDNTTFVVLENFHRFLESAEVIQEVLIQIQLGKQCGQHLIVMSPLVKLPVELERYFVVLEHDLPDRGQLNEIATALGGDLDSGTDNSVEATVLDAACGLTRYEAESAFSLSIVRHGRFDPKEIWELKSRSLKRSGLLTLHKSESGFDTLGGLDSLKDFCRRSLHSEADQKVNAKPRGILMLGVPGTGKSAFAKALGKETNRPVLCLDVGALMGSLVGQTENNIRQALKTADAMAPCILFVDEVEKALAGATSGSKGDSGVSSRLFGTLLTWLNDHTTEVYVVMTCNDIRQLPPEFSRAERFDAVMFLDLPQRAEKDSIWRLYRKEFEIPSGCVRPGDDSWTGAEIKACCRLSKLLDISLVEASDYIVPVGVTAAEEVDRLRKWASGRCLCATKGGIYRVREKGARKVIPPESSVN